MRWGKTTEVIHMPKRVKRDWKTYNDQLVKRGEVQGNFNLAALFWIESGHREVSRSSLRRVVLHYNSGHC